MHSDQASIHMKCRRVGGGGGGANSGRVAEARRTWKIENDMVAWREYAHFGRRRAVMARACKLQVT